MIVGCYSIDLYCDSGKEKPYGAAGHWSEPDTFAGESFAECAREARKAGWKIDRKNGIAICPNCHKERPPKKG